jgi:CHRD domain
MNKSRVKKLLATSLLVLASYGPSAGAAVLVYTTSFVPEAIGATGSGGSTVTIDTALNSLRIEVNFSGLSGNATTSHVHCCTINPGIGTAPPATAATGFPGFPLGGSSGVYDQTFDTTLASTWNASFVTASGGTTASALLAFISGMDNNRSYFNVHSTVFPGGEIRGFYQPQVVPVPGAMWLLGTGIVTLVLRRLRRS